MWNLISGHIFCRLRAPVPEGTEEEHASMCELCLSLSLCIFLSVLSLYISLCLSVALSSLSPLSVSLFCQSISGHIFCQLRAPVPEGTEEEHASMCEFYLSPLFLLSLSLSIFMSVLSLYLSLALSCLSLSACLSPCVSTVSLLPASPLPLCLSVSRISPSKDTSSVGFELQYQRGQRRNMPPNVSFTSLSLSLSLSIFYLSVCSLSVHLSLSLSCSLLPVSPLSLLLSLCKSVSLITPSQCTSSVSLELQYQRGQRKNMPPCVSYASFFLSPPCMFLLCLSLSISLPVSCSLLPVSIPLSISLLSVHLWAHLLSAASPGTRRDRARTCLHV